MHRRIECNLGTEVIERIARKYGTECRTAKTVEVRIVFYGAAEGRRTLDACQPQVGAMRVGPKTALHFSLNPARLRGGRIRENLSIVAENRMRLTCGCGHAMLYTAHQRRMANTEYLKQEFKDMYMSKLRNGASATDAEREAAEKVYIEQSSGKNASCEKCGALILSKPQRLRTVLFPSGAENEDPLAKTPEQGRDFLAEAELGDPIPKVWAVYRLGEVPLAWTPETEEQVALVAGLAKLGRAVLPYGLAKEASDNGFGGIEGLRVVAPRNGVVGQVDRRMLELNEKEAKQIFGHKFKIFGRD